MPYIACNEHGRQPCSITTEYLAKVIREKKGYIQNVYAIELNIGLAVTYHLVNEQFLIDNNFSIRENSFQQIAIEDEEVAFEIYGQLKPICMVCYNVYLSTHNISKPHESKGDLW